LATFAASV